MKQAEKLLESWVKINSLLKNSRITKGLSYNESTVMLCVYKQYLQNENKGISIKDVIIQTKMLKSLATRTIKSLEEKGLIEKYEGLEDKRTVYVRCIRKNLDAFLQVHNNSVSIASQIIEIIGPEDAEHFIRIVEKIEKVQEKLF